MATVDPADFNVVAEVIASGQLWRGNGRSWTGQPGPAPDTATDQLERAFSNHLGLRYVHAVNSGTSANEAAIAGLGLNPGDEVICPAACPTFVPLAVIAAGCIPIFADVHPETLSLDPKALERVCGRSTRAVVVVHLWGLPAEIPEILQESNRLELKVTEDCAQAYGSRIDGQRVGTFGESCSFSLQQSKHITSGEGGLFATGEMEPYMRAVLYSNSGIPSYRFGVDQGTCNPKGTRGHYAFGHNHRMGEMQAALALAQLSRLDRIVDQRASLVDVIESILVKLGTASVRKVPVQSRADVSYWRYPILVPPGRGTYVGIPYLEPFFQQMEHSRRTPFGAELPSYVHYQPGICPQAEFGATQIRVIDLHQDDLPRSVERRVSACIDDLS